MTIAVNDRFIQHTGDGVTTSFAFDFPITATSELIVTNTSTAGVSTTQTLTTHYTVTILGTGLGSIAYVTAPASGVKVNIAGSTPDEQTADYTSSDSFPASAHEGSMDKQAKGIQEIRSAVARAIKLPYGETATALVSAAARAGYVGGFDASTGAFGPTSLNISVLEDLSALSDSALADIAAVVALYDAGLIYTETETDTLLDTKATVGTYAEMRALTLAAVATLSGFIMTDRGMGLFEWQTGDQSANVTADPGAGVWVTPTADATGATGAWKRIWSGPANLRWWGAVGDASTDDTTAVQRAFDWMEAASGAATDSRSLFVPLGKYKLTSAVTITEGMRVFGEGCTMYRDRPFSTDVEEAGSWFYIAHTGIGFSCGGQGATGVRSGMRFEDIGTYRDQPTPAISWAPTAHGYDFFFDDVESVYMGGVALLNPTKGIAIDGVSGRILLTDLMMDAFDIGIDIIRASGVVRIDHVQQYPYWYDDNIDTVDYIKDYKRENLNVIKIARASHPILNNIFGIYHRRLVFFLETADGWPGRVQAANWSSDNGKRLFEIDASVTSGIELDLVNYNSYGFGGDDESYGILISGNNNRLNLVNGQLERYGRSAISIAAATSGNYVRLNGVYIDDYNNEGTAFAAIRNAAAGNTIEVIGQPTITNGNSGAAYLATGKIILPPLSAKITSATTDGSGDYVITHNLGLIPTYAHVEHLGTANYVAKIANTKTATQMTVRILLANTGAAQASTAFNLEWVVRHDGV